MPRYRVTVGPAARRQLERLPPPIQVRVRIAIRALASNPRPAGAQLLSGSAGHTWRIRVGDYRVLFEVHDDQLVVLVVRAGHRREVYRGRRISETIAPYAPNADRPLPHGGRSWTREVLYSDQTR